MKHVFVLNQFAVPRSAAGGTRHAELFARLDGWRPVIFAGRTTLAGERLPADPLFEPVWVTPYSSNGPSRVLNWLSFSAVALMKGLATRSCPAVVYGSSPHMGAALAGLAIARARHASFVLEIRDLWPQILVETGTLSENSRLYQMLKRLELSLYEAADRIVVLAEGNAEAIGSQGPWGKKIDFIPNGADVDDFRPSRRRPALREQYRFDRFTVVYAGAHGPANGLDLVLDAAEVLGGEAIDFVLIGDGVDKKRLVAEARRRELENVRFMDPVPKSEMRDVLGAADIGLHCLADVELFSSGVSPNKLYDYMAAGLPVVTNTPGETARLVRTSGAGIAVDPNHIADGVRELWREPELVRANRSRKGRKFMQLHRSRTALAVRLGAILDAVSSEAGATSH